MADKAKKRKKSRSRPGGPSWISPLFERDMERMMDDSWQKDSHPGGPRGGFDGRLRSAARRTRRSEKDDIVVKAVIPGNGERQH